MIVTTDMLLSVILGFTMITMVIMYVAYVSLLAHVQQGHKKLLERIDEYDNNVAGVEEKLYDYICDISYLKLHLQQTTKAVTAMKSQTQNIVPLADSFHQWATATSSKLHFMHNEMIAVANGVLGDNVEPAMEPSIGRNSGECEDSVVFCHDGRKSITVQQHKEFFAIVGSDTDITEDVEDDLSF